MYTKRQKYQNSCFPCALQIALVNIRNLPPTYGDRLEDDFNREMVERTRQDLDSAAPDELHVGGIISSLGLPLGNGFLVGPTELSGHEQDFAQRINNTLNANENVAFVIGLEHAFAVFKDSETGKWYIVDTRSGEAEECGDNIYARGEDGAIVFSSSGRNIVGGHFVMMVSQEH